MTAYIANSELTRERIRAFYGRDAAVVHPPVGVERFVATPADPGDAFLVVGELARHKNVAVALAAAERAGAPVRVVGDGPELAALRRRFPAAEFLGRVGDAELATLYSRCRALIVTAVEEFGITMVEAQAAGRPVLAVARGGAAEIVDDGVTGRLVAPGDVPAMAQALRDTDWEAFDPASLRASAERFSVARFRRRLADEVARAATFATPLA